MGVGFSTTTRQAADSETLKWQLTLICDSIRHRDSPPPVVPTPPRAGGGSGGRGGGRREGGPTSYLAHVLLLYHLRGFTYTSLRHTVAVARDVLATTPPVIVRHELARVASRTAMRWRHGRGEVHTICVHSCRLRCPCRREHLPSLPAWVAEAYRREITTARMLHGLFVTPSPPHWRYSSFAHAVTAQNNFLTTACKLA
jgi:hypothetical protein